MADAWLCCLGIDAIGVDSKQIARYSNDMSYVKQPVEHRATFGLRIRGQAAHMPEIKVFELLRFQDERGFFSETYHKQHLHEHGIDTEFVQDNHSMSRVQGTLRGLHYQIEPFAQAKLVRVTHGAIFDVAVDLRRGSPTFGQHVSAIISAEKWNQILIPVGFAHGFCTLDPNTEVQYKASNYYSPEHERGLLWNDPELGIDWPATTDEVTLSDKDRENPPLAALQELF